ncbi:MAG: hypothetical protein OEY79_03225 [Anaplasmataceae bacterium]|nr:hypothetical protein [Anaplasmataceae bacterium]
MKYLFLLLMVFCFSANALTQKDKETFEFCLKHNIKDCRVENNNYITNNYPSSCPTGQKDCWHTEQSKTRTDVSHWCVGKNENC